jgi:hypothetical protein
MVRYGHHIRIPVKGNINEHVEEQFGTPREKRTHRHHHTHAAPGAGFAVAGDDTAAKRYISEGIN